jgi:DNA-binding MarR family transcriptional regulator
MDAIFFEMKRAYYATLNFSRPSLRTFGLTPARFDLIVAILKGHHPTQSFVRAKLGVARSTISRMLAAMEKAGLVRRERHPCDQRQRRIELTDEGRRRYCAASDDLVLSSITSLAVDCTLARERCFTPTNGYSFEDQPHLENMGWHCQQMRDDLTEHLGALRASFGDTAARFFYPDGHPP